MDPFVFFVLYIGQNTFLFMLEAVFSVF